MTVEHSPRRGLLHPRTALLGTSLGVAALVCGLLGAPAATAAYDPNDYPSWSDVEAAKSSEAATSAEVDRISAALVGLRAEAARLGDEAVARAGEAELAAQALDEAAQKVAALEARSDTAVAEADTAKKQAGQIAAQLYRSGGSELSVNLFVSGSQESSQLLYKLGTMSQLTQQSTQLQDAAQAKRNVAETLEAQAQVARDAREKLSTAAQESLASAEAAEDAAQEVVRTQQAQTDTLYAQLASLKNTTADVEKKYADGQAAKASFEQQQREAAAEAERQRRAQEDANNGGGDDDPVAYTPPTVVGGGMSPAEAQNFAAAQMPIYGWGSGEYSCLVSLWNGESGWRWNANNPSSGAYGIPQSLPASKMGTIAADYRTNAATQIHWGLQYIVAAYGTPCNAWGKWQARSPHWY